MSYISASDLVFNNNNGIYSGGFNVQAIMMKNGISPIMTINNNDSQNGGSKVSDIFEGLVVPAYAYHNNYQSGGKHNNYKTYDNSSEEDDDVVDEDLHDKLLELMKNQDNDVKQNKKKNTKKSIFKKNGTKKNKNKNGK